MGRLRDDFAALVATGEGADLARSALAIARIAYPALDPGPSLAELDTIAGAVQKRLAPRTPPVDVATALAAHLFRECGFRGNQDNYYDPRNSFLNDVLTRRLGIPISLCIVFLETGRRLGLALEGVGFPGHFLVRVDGDSGPVVLDPFLRGRPIGRDEMLQRLRAFYASNGGSGENLQRVLPQVL